MNFKIKTVVTQQQTHNQYMQSGLGFTPPTINVLRYDLYVESGGWTKLGQFDSKGSAKVFAENYKNANHEEEFSL